MYKIKFAGEEEEINISHRQLGLLRGSSCWLGLNQIKPIYDPHQPDGRANLTASAFN